MECAKESVSYEELDIWQMSKVLYWKER